MDADAFRAEFPVLERIAYLNAGTDGPVPRRGFDAAVARLREELEGGRSGAAYFDGLKELGTRLRERLAGFMGCDPEEVALTRSTTDGVSTVLSAIHDLGSGDEVLTSDEEHPGLLAPLELARRRLGFEVRQAPFAGLAEAVGERTRLVATSHVSWVGGKVVDAAGIRATGARLLLDGAQGLGAVPVDVRALDCDYYAASGQKWMCGPDGSGCLYVRGDRCGELMPPWPSYVSLAEPARASELIVHDGARRFDMGVSPGPATSWALAAADVLAEAGLDAVTGRAAEQAERLAAALTERGHEVAPRGRTTLVSWRSDDAEGDVARLAERGVVVRQLPGLGLVRASVGAWTSDADLERLLEAL
ncbi:MAG: L-cysteine/cystine lyase [Thermoleophilaceae bacterium]|nr:L-cysteine/cystine lyase [Thermoleophilaceae bacterium]